MRIVAVTVLLVTAGCSFGDEVAAVRTGPDPCVQRGGWSTGPEARWVREIVKAGGYNVFSETGSALVASKEGQEFYIWATESNVPSRMPNWRRLAVVRGVPIYGDRSVWRGWHARGFTFWVQGSGVPAAGRLAPIVDARLRMPYREVCAGRRSAG
jgi:hypothetical protein